MTRKGKLYGACLFYILFLALIVLLCLADRQPIGPEGTTVGLARVNAAVRNLLPGLGGEGEGVHMGLYKLTEYLGYFSILIACLFALLGFLQLLRRRSLRGVDPQLLAMGGLFILLAVLYVFFEKVIVNCRPIVLPGEAGPEASFPSSHTMLTCTILGSVCVVLKKYVSVPWLCALLRVLCVALILGMVCGRLLCGCHWFTDILGGVLVSVAMLFLFSAAAFPEEDG